MRDLDILLTSEMTAEEWKKFRKRWIAEYANELHIECGAELEEAKELSGARFEDYVGQEGYTGRNERIYAQRNAGYFD